MNTLNEQDKAMMDHEETREWLLDYMRASAEHPEKCAVECVASPSGRSAHFTPRCSGTDAARFIGAKGSTFRALCRLVVWRGHRLGHTYTLASVQADPARRSGPCPPATPDWCSALWVCAFDSFVRGALGEVDGSYSGGFPLVVSYRARVPESEMEGLGEAVRVLANSLASSMRGEVLVELEAA